MDKKVKSYFKEQSIFFISAIKWICISTFIGIIVGTVVALFIKLVSHGVSYVSNINYYYLLLPIALFLSSFIIIKLAPDAKGHGTEKAIEAVHKNSGRSDFKVVPVKLVSTLITIIFGGSVGMEGPGTQIGSGIASLVGNFFKMDDTDTKRLVVCGISAGFVAVFGAPIGAAVFAAEVLYIGKISYVSLLPAVIASYTSYFTGLYIGTSALNFSIAFIPKYRISMFLKIVAFGIFIGIAARFFIAFINFVEKIFGKIRFYNPLKGIIGGLIIIVFVVLVGSDYIGIGEEVIQRAMAGDKLNGFSSLFKMFTTAITLSSGGSGGILTPMLYIGSSLGNTWAAIFNQNLAFFSAIGMAAFFGCCANTPIAAIIIALELFGHSTGIYTSIACVVAYLIMGHTSIYPTQILVTSKSPSIKYDTNKEIINSKSKDVVLKYSFQKKLFGDKNKD
ncbi:chloride channel protein [Clostridium tagluense]|uniref:Permease n=1 Tax=Clostridium tagluense TaxID=360422 RepID=A0A401UMP4_9CLOT|nr:chloride channel protein [Clostridium tagluense]GCD10781.1 permease [Clostridium tagluense]